MPRPAKTHRMFNALLEHVKTLPDRPDPADMASRIANESPEPGVALAVQAYVSIIQKGLNTSELELTPQPNLLPIIGTENYVDYLVTLWLLDRDDKYLFALMRQLTSDNEAIKEYAENVHKWMMKACPAYKIASTRIRNNPATSTQIH